MRRAIQTMAVMLMLTATAWGAPGGLKLPDPDTALSDPAVEAVAGFIFSDEFEKKYITKSERLLPPNDPRTLYVKRVTDRLIKVVKTDRPDLVFEVKVVQGDDINALCIPGGHIYVYTGLLDFIKQKFPADEQEDVLAAAVGHEMAHAVLRHTLQTWARSNEYEQVLTDKKIFKKLLLTTNRAMELEADRYGALYMLRANYRIAAALDLFDKMPSSKSLESDHPTGGQRVRQLRAYMEQLRGIVDLWNEGLKAANAQNNTQARICFTALRSQFPQLPSVHNNLGWVLYALYQESIPDGKRAPQQVAYSYIPNLGITVRGGDLGDASLLNAAQDEFSEALKLNPSLVAAYEGSAACALEAGNPKLAMEMLQKAGKVASKNASLANMWGVVHERQGNQAAALAQYDQAFRLDSAFLPAVYNLGCAYERQGKKQQATEVFLKYVNVDRNGYWSDQARQRLQRLGARVPPKATEPAATTASEVGIGATVEQVVKQLGPPDDKKALVSGTEVYHYKKGLDVHLSSTGVTAVMISSPGGGKVAGIEVGMTPADVTTALGTPQTARDGDNGEQLWSYPWRGLVIGVTDGRVSSITLQR